MISASGIKVNRETPTVAPDSASLRIFKTSKLRHLRWQFTTAFAGSYFGVRTSKFSTGKNCRLVNWPVLLAVTNQLYWMVSKALASAGENPVAVNTFKSIHSEAVVLLR